MIEYSHQLSKNTEDLSMNTETGTGTGSAYEYVISERKTALLVFKKGALIVLYVFWAVAFLLVGGYVEEVTTSHPLDERV